MANPKFSAAIVASHGRTIHAADEPNVPYDCFRSYKFGEIGIERIKVRDRKLVPEDKWILDDAVTNIPSDGNPILVYENIYGWHWYNRVLPRLYAHVAHDPATPVAIDYFREFADKPGVWEHIEFYSIIHEIDPRPGGSYDDGACQFKLLPFDEWPANA